LVAIVVALGSVLGSIHDFDSSEFNTQLRTSSINLARIGPDAGVFVRVGSSTQRADAARAEEMRRVARAALPTNSLLAGTGDAQSVV
jgi:hypothetical protein